jgi:cephalosporin hydroxylase
MPTERTSDDVARQLPPSVSVDIGRASLREYWLARALQHTDDSYAGVPMSKFPEDLRAYEHLLWLDRPSTVVELGVHYGGAALWFRDRLRTLAAYGHIEHPRVVGVEIDTEAAREHLSRVAPDWERDIVLIDGDVTDPDTPARLASAIDPGARCLVIEDTAHTYETTAASLRAFNHLVPENGFFVVEDGTVDREELRLSPTWPRGVLRAVDEWLETDEGSRFTVRRDLELYGLSNHPCGFLQRAARGQEQEEHDGASGVQVAVHDLQGLIVQLEESQRSTDAWMDRALTSERVREEWQHLQAEWHARATEAEKYVQRWERRAAIAEKALEEVRESTSWRLTRPLRDLGRRVRRRS